MDTAESRLKETIFLVEATGYERHSLWVSFAARSNRRINHGYSVTWDSRGGWLICVGNIDGRPVTIETTFELIDGEQVCFWSASSEVVDYAMISEWFDQRFTAKWDAGRSAKCDAWNFHHCLAAIREKKTQDDGTTILTEAG